MVSAAAAGPSARTISVATTADGPLSANEVAVEQPAAGLVHLDVHLRSLVFRSAEPDGELYSCEAPGLGRLGRPDGADLPAYATFLALPREGRPRLEWSAAPFAPMLTAPIAELGRRRLGEPCQPALENTTPPVVELGEPRWWRGLRVVPLWVRPVRYDAREETVYASPHVRVVVETVPESPADGDVSVYAASGRGALRAGVANLAALERLGYAAAGSAAGAANPEDTLGGGSDPGPPLTSESCGDYLIVAADAFCDYDPGSGDRTLHPSLHSLVKDIEGRRGMDAEARCLEDDDILSAPGGDESEKIRNTIRSCPAKPAYLLLVGEPSGSGSAWLPEYDEAPSAPTDNYYCADLTGAYQRGLTDIACGRLRARDASELAGGVDKIVAYADLPPLAERRATLVYQQDPFLPAARVVADASYDTLTRLGFFTDRLFEWLGTSTAPALTDAIDEGRSLVFYGGHGDLMAWAVPPFGNSDVAALQNAGRYPFVAAFACSTASYAWPTTIGDAFVETPDKGAIAYFGASETTYDPAPWEQNRGLLAALAAQRAGALGDIVDAGEVLAYLAMGGFPPAETAIEQFVLIGDPGLALRTEAGDLAAFWRFEDEPADASGWERDLSVLSGAAAYGEGRVGRAATFDGTTVLGTSEAPPGMPDEITVALWLDAGIGWDRWVVTRGPAGEPMDWGLRANGLSGALELTLRDAYGTPHVYELPYEGFGHWHHVAFTFDAAAVYRVKLFVDGELRLATFGVANLPPNAEPIRVGGPADLGSCFVGSADELRVYGRALSEEELRELSGGRDHGLVAWYRGHCASDDFSGDDLCYDYGADEHDQVLVDGALGADYRGPFGLGQTFRDARFEADDAPSMTIDGSLSLATWLHTEPAPSGSVLRKADGGTTEYELRVAGGEIAGEVAGCAVATPLPPVGGWHHVALVRDAPAVTLALYVDAVVADSVACASAVPDTDAPLELAPQLVGTIADTRLYRRALLPTELGRLARVGEAVLHLPLGDRGGTDLSAFGHHLWSEGAPTPVEGRDAAPEGATRFDGVDDRLWTPSTPALRLDEESLTLSAWIWPDSAQYGWIVAKGTPTDYGLYLSSGYLGCRVGGASGIVSFAEYGRWSHVACTYDQWAGKSRIYVDGVLRYAFNRGGEHSGGDGELVVGARGTSYGYRGRLDDLRVERRAWDDEEVADTAAQVHLAEIGRYDFEEWAGDAIADESPYGMDLTHLAPPPPPLEPSFDGQCFASDGDDVLATAPDATLATLSRGFGASFWLWTAPDPYGGLVIGEGEHPGTYVAELLYEDETFVLRQVRGFGYVSAGGVLVDVRHGLRFEYLAGGRWFEQTIPYASHGRWAHVVVSYDGDAGRLDAYRDGLRVASLDVAGDLADTTSALALLGHPVAVEGPEARVDRLRLFGRALTAGEARDLFLSEHFAARWRLDEEPIRDDGALGLNGTLHGDAFVQTKHRWQGGALALDGEGDSLSFPHVPELQRLERAMTLSFWVRPSYLCEGIAVAKGAVDEYAFQVEFQSASQLIRVRWRAGDGRFLYVPINFNDFGGGWHNVQIRFDADGDGWFEILLDGTRAGIRFVGEVGLYHDEHDLTFGDWSDPEPNAFQGHIDDIHLFDRRLEDIELAQLRSSRVLELPLTADFEDDSPFGRGVVVHGEPSFSGGGVEFDGAFDFLEVLPDDMTRDLARQFAISFDLKPRAGEEGTVLVLDDYVASPRIYMQGGRLRVQFGLDGPSYANDHVDLADYYGEYVPVVIRWNRFLSGGRLEIEVDGDNQPHPGVQGYFLDDGGHVLIGSSKRYRAFLAAFGLRALTIDRRHVP